MPVHIDAIRAHPSKPAMYIDYVEDLGGETSKSLRNQQTTRRRRRRIPLRGLGSLVPTESSVPELDLNKLGDRELQAIKSEMEIEFEKNRVKTSDPDFEYDKRVEFEAVDGPVENDWDSDQEIEKLQPKPEASQPGTATVAQPSPSINIIRTASSPEPPSDSECIGTSIAEDVSALSVDLEDVLKYLPSTTAMARPVTEPPTTAIPAASWQQQQHQQQTEEVESEHESAPLPQFSPRTAAATMTFLAPAPTLAAAASRDEADYSADFSDFGAGATVSEAVSSVGGGSGSEADGTGPASDEESDAEESFGEGATHSDLESHASSDHGDHGSTAASESIGGTTSPPQIQQVSEPKDDDDQDDGDVGDHDDGDDIEEDIEIEAFEDDNEDNV
ncbi:CEP19-like protein-domain-containing protein [Blastocladiella britannica]|nr:CEP19-like protein-domain-containing protein [Blastocladiella britannica]